MPRIGLISDTHSFLDEKVYKYFDDCDEVWHAGDFGSIEVSDQLSQFKPLRGVYGNIDGHDIRIVHPEDLIFEIEGKKIWMRHIVGYPKRYAKGITSLIEQIKPDLIICGHSHILRVMKDEKRDLLYMNPGAAGKHGFHHVRTLLKFDIKEGNLSELKVIELGKRA